MYIVDFYIGKARNKNDEKDSLSEKAQAIGLGPLSTNYCFLFRTSHSQICGFYAFENRPIQFYLPIFFSFLV